MVSKKVLNPSKNELFQPMFEPNMYKSNSWLNFLIQILCPYLTQTWVETTLHFLDRFSVAKGLGGY